MTGFLQRIHRYLQLGLVTTEQVQSLASLTIQYWAPMSRVWTNSTLSLELLGSSGTALPMLPTSLPSLMQVLLTFMVLSGLSEQMALVQVQPLSKKKGILACSYQVPKQLLMSTYDTVTGSACLRLPQGASTSSATPASPMTEATTAPRMRADQAAINFIASNFSIRSYIDYQKILRKLQNCITKKPILPPQAMQDFQPLVLARMGCQKTTQDKAQKIKLQIQILLLKILFMQNRANIRETPGEACLALIPSKNHILFLECLRQSLRYPYVMNSLFSFDVLMKQVRIENLHRTHDSLFQMQNRKQLKDRLHCFLNKPILIMYACAQLKIFGPRYLDHSLVFQQQEAFFSHRPTVTGAVLTPLSFSLRL